MSGTLGYKRFAVQGGDWGAITAARMGYAHADKLIGIHVNLLAVRRDPGMVKNPTAEERVFLAELNHWLKEETGYQWIQGTRPQTLSFGLTDSPAGLAAWIIEKFRAWSDCGGDVESVFTRDQMLADISFYWFTGAIGSSFYPYYFRLPSALDDPGRRRGHRSDRLRRIPARDPESAALAGRDNVHRHPPLDGHAEGRPFRRHGAT